MRGILIKATLNIHQSKQQVHNPKTTTLNKQIAIALIL